nr:transposase [Nostoc sp. DedQUE02]
MNYTLTKLAEHLEQISHYKINSYLNNEKLTQRLLWDNVKDIIEVSENANLVFDDTEIDKRYAIEIQTTKRQYSGNEHRVIQGIRLINCIYDNHELGKFWVVDYRIYDPDREGKTKIVHVIEMLQNLVYHKVLPFQTVLMDTWYATNKLMFYIDGLGKYYYCPLKRNRLVDDTDKQEDYKRIELLSWDNEELKSGKIVKIKKFPAAKKVKLFRVTVSTDRTDFIATNDLSQASTDVVQQVCKVRWKIEEFHRELKQLTGIESCQCRKGRIQRNHIACAILVWLRLKDLAYKTGQTIYQIKHGLLSNYLVQQLKRPDFPMFIV